MPMCAAELHEMGRATRMANPRMLFRTVDHFIERKEDCRTQGIGCIPLYWVSEGFVQPEQRFTIDKASILYQILVPCLAA